MIVYNVCLFSTILGCDINIMYRPASSVLAEFKFRAVLTHKINHRIISYKDIDRVEHSNGVSVLRAMYAYANQLHFINQDFLFHYLLSWEAITIGAALLSSEFKFTPLHNIT